MRKIAENVWQKIKHQKVNAKAGKGYKLRRELGFPMGKIYIKKQQY